MCLREKQFKQIPHVVGRLESIMIINDKNEYQNYIGRFTIRLDKAVRKQIQILCIELEKITNDRFVKQYIRERAESVFYYYDEKVKS